MAATATPKNLHLAEEHDEEEMTNGNGSNDLSRDLETDDTIKDPVEDRLTLAERNERLHDQLKVGIARALSNCAMAGFKATIASGVKRHYRRSLPPHANGNCGFRNSVIDSELRFATRSICVMQAADPSGGGGGGSGGSCATTTVKFQSARFVVRKTMHV